MKKKTPTRGRGGAGKSGSRDATTGGPTSKRGDAPDASDAPVFVDETGRRGRTFRRIGITVGLACAAYAVVIVGTLLSGYEDALRG